jgi:Fe-Mn family superoxide dismutase
MSAKLEATSTVAQSVNYSPKNYDHLLGMPGFSETLLKNHFKLYQGYVTNTNTVIEKIGALVKEDKDRTPEFSELKRRMGWEFNGMRLHEYYFDNLGGKQPLNANSPLTQLITDNFGGFDRWQKEFISTGAMRGIGWVILYKDPVSNRLINFWIEEHQANHLAGGTPLLVMDVFEHAFITDYGLDRAKYIENFFKNINWEVVSKRLGD